MIFQTPEVLTAKELRQLAQLGQKDMVDLSLGLVSTAYQVYRVNSLLIMVESDDAVLTLTAVIQQGRPGQSFRELAKGLRKLAASWGLASIETTSHTPQVTKLLKLVGAKVASTTLVMEV